ncbi:MAG TPA: dihydrodipicolinate reductase [Thermoanaerobaculia bacterium]|nr:dihydrodipicolinate reductase [Thermoanaerobaculia bacterium]
MAETIRVAQFGLGPIGQACVRTLAAKPGMEVVAGIDLDPEKVGRDVGTVCGLAEPLGVEVEPDAAASLARARPHVVLHTTQSFLHTVEEQLTTLLGAGVAVVSSTEELFYPEPRDSDFCDRIDRVARQHGVAVVGTGVNPGFVMDLLPVFLTGICTEVDTLEVFRVVDAGQRRLPLRRKVGAGLTVEAWEERRRAGGFGHIGLVESALAVAGTLGWPVDAYTDELEPVVAERAVAGSEPAVEAGSVAGIHQVVQVSSGGRRRLTLDLAMYVGAEGSEDRVVVHGTPPLTVRAEGGIFGDTATVAALVNTIPQILGARPGLRTMMDLPVPRAFGT